MIKSRKIIRRGHNAGFASKFLLPVMVLFTTNQAITHAQELPLWELGLGFGGLHQPFYPGSDETRNLLFPVPLPIYRGNIVKADDDGVRAELKLSDRVKFDMSLDFNFAIDSDDVELRDGMDDIDSLLQIGPSLEVSLKQTEQSQWLLKLPFRAAVSFGDGVEGLGYNFAPNITYFRKFEFKGQPWRFSAAVGPSFGSSEYNNVFYGVDSEFVTEIRPEYESDSGYAGARTLLTLKSQNSKRLLVWFLRYDNIDGAKFDDSPLVANSGRLSAGFVYSHFFWKSKRFVQNSN